MDVDELGTDAYDEDLSARQARQKKSLDAKHSEARRLVACDRKRKELAETIQKLQQELEAIDKTTEEVKDRYKQVSDEFDSAMQLDGPDRKKQRFSPPEAVVADPDPVQEMGIAEVEENNNNNNNNNNYSPVPVEEIDIPREISEFIKKAVRDKAESLPTFRTVDIVVTTTQNEKLNAVGNPKRADREAWPHLLFPPNANISLQRFLSQHREPYFVLPTLYVLLCDPDFIPVSDARPTPGNNLFKLFIGYIFKNGGKHLNESKAELLRFHPQAVQNSPQLQQELDELALKLVFIRRKYEILLANVQLNGAPVRLPDSPQMDNDQRPGTTVPQQVIINTVNTTVHAGQNRIDLHQPNLENFNDDDNDGDNDDDDDDDDESLPPPLPEVYKKKGKVPRPPRSIASCTGSNNLQAFSCVIKHLNDLGIPVQAAYKKTSSAVKRKGIVEYKWRLAPPAGHKRELAIYESCRPSLNTLCKQIEKVFPDFYTMSEEERLRIYAVENNNNNNNKYKEADGLATKNITRSNWLAKLARYIEKYRTVHGIFIQAWFKKSNSTYWEVVCPPPTRQGDLTEAQMDLLREVNAALNDVVIQYQNFFHPEEDY